RSRAAGIASRPQDGEGAKRPPRELDLWAFYRRLSRACADPRTRTKAAIHAVSYYLAYISQIPKSIKNNHKIARKAAAASGGRHKPPEPVSPITSQTPPARRRPSHARPSSGAARAPNHPRPHFHPSPANDPLTPEHRRLSRASSAPPPSLKTLKPLRRIKPPRSPTHNPYRRPPRQQPPQEKLRNDVHDPRHHARLPPERRERLFHHRARLHDR